MKGKKWIKDVGVEAGGDQVMYKVRGRNATRKKRNDNKKQGMSTIDESLQGESINICIPTDFHINIFSLPANQQDPVFCVAPK